MGYANYGGKGADRGEYPPAHSHPPPHHLMYDPVGGHPPPLPQDPHYPWVPPSPSPSPPYDTPHYPYPGYDPHKVTHPGRGTVAPTHPPHPHQLVRGAYGRGVPTLPGNRGNGRPEEYPNPHPPHPQAVPQSGKGVSAHTAPPPTGVPQVGVYRHDPYSGALGVEVVPHYEDGIVRGSCEMQFDPTQGERERSCREIHLGRGAVVAGRGQQSEGVMGHASEHHRQGGEGCERQQAPPNGVNGGGYPAPNGNGVDRAEKANTAETAAGHPSSTQGSPAGSDAQDGKADRTPEGAVPCGNGNGVAVAVAAVEVEKKVEEVPESEVPKVVPKAAKAKANQEAEAAKVKEAKDAKDAKDAAAKEAKEAKEAQEALKAKAAKEKEKKAAQEKEKEKAVKAKAKADALKAKTAEAAAAKAKAEAEAKKVKADEAAAAAKAKRKAEEQTAKRLEQEKAKAQAEEARVKAAEAAEKKKADEEKRRAAKEEKRKRDKEKKQREREQKELEEQQQEQLEEARRAQEAKEQEPSDDVIEGPAKKKKKKQKAVRTLSEREEEELLSQLMQLERAPAPAATQERPKARTIKEYKERKGNEKGTTKPAVCTIRTQIDDSVVLFEKGSYEEALKKLDDAQKEAERRPGKRLEQVQCSLKKAANYRALAHHNPHRTMEYYKEVNRELLKANALCRTGDSGDLLCSPEMHPGLFATELQRGHLCAEMGNLQKAYTHYQMACKTAQARQQYCKGAERTQATHDIVDAVCKMCDCVRKFAASGRYLSDAQMRNVDIMMDSAKAAAASIDAVGMHFILYAQIVIYEYKENWKKLHELKDDEQLESGCEYQDVIHAAAAGLGKRDGIKPLEGLLKKAANVYQELKISCLLCWSLLKLRDIEVVKTKATALLSREKEFRQKGMGGCLWDQYMKYLKGYLKLAEKGAEFSDKELCYPRCKDTSEEPTALEF